MERRNLRIATATAVIVRLQRIWKSIISFQTMITWQCPSSIVIGRKRGGGGAKKKLLRQHQILDGHNNSGHLPIDYPGDGDLFLLLLGLPGKIEAEEG